MPNVSTFQWIKNKCIRRRRMSLTNCRQPAVWHHQQVLVPQHGYPAAPAVQTTPRPGRLRQQRRQPLAALQVQEQPAAPLSQRQLAAREGAQLRRRGHAPPLAEPLGGVVQLERRVWRRRRGLSRVLFGNGDKLCLPRGWETSRRFRFVFIFNCLIGFF